MKLSWLFIAIVLIHSFFTCGAAAGHLEDASHQSVDIVFDDDHQIEHQIVADQDHDVEHQHQFHAHISCIAGYGLSIVATPVIHSSKATSVVFDKSLTHQPSVPPPNA